MTDPTNYLYLNDIETKIKFIYYPQQPQLLFVVKRFALINISLIVMLTTFVLILAVFQ